MMILGMGVNVTARRRIRRSGIEGVRTARPCGPPLSGRRRECAGSGTCARPHRKLDRRGDCSNRIAKQASDLTPSQTPAISP